MKDDTSHHQLKRFDHIIHRLTMQQYNLTVLKQGKMGFSISLSSSGLHDALSRGSLISKTVLVLNYAVLRCATLCDAVLCYAMLCCAVLCCAMQ
jgi:hypothetical protein